jgi:hypothetical protein
MAGDRLDSRESARPPHAPYSRVNVSHYPETLMSGLD